MRMNQAEFIQQKQNLRLLKGCPLSVLHALHMVREQRMGAVGSIWLENATGFSDKQIMEALILLESWGQVERIRSCNWALVKNPSMLPLVTALCDPKPMPGDPSPRLQTNKPGIAGG